MFYFDWALLNLLIENIYHLDFGGMERFELHPTSTNTCDLCKALQDRSHHKPTCECVP